MERVTSSGILTKATPHGIWIGENFHLFRRKLNQPIEVFETSVSGHFSFLAVENHAVLLTLGSKSLFADDLTGIKKARKAAFTINEHSLYVIDGDELLQYSTLPTAQIRRIPISIPEVPKSFVVCSSLHFIALRFESANPQLLGITPHALKPYKGNLKAWLNQTITEPKPEPSKNYQPSEDIETHALEAQAFAQYTKDILKYVIDKRNFLIGRIETVHQKTQKSTQRTTEVLRKCQELNRRIQIVLENLDTDEDAQCNVDIVKKVNATLKLNTLSPTPLTRRVAGLYLSLKIPERIEALKSPHLDP